MTITIVGVYFCGFERNPFVRVGRCSSTKGLFVVLHPGREFHVAPRHADPGHFSATREMGYVTTRNLGRVQISGEKVERLKLNHTNLQA